MHSWAEKFPYLQSQELYCHHMTSYAVCSPPSLLSAHTILESQLAHH